MNIRLERAHCSQCADVLFFFLSIYMIKKIYIRSCHKQKTKDKLDVSGNESPSHDVAVNASHIDFEIKNDESCESCSPNNGGEGGGR